MTDWSEKQVLCKIHRWYRSYSSDIDNYLDIRQLEWWYKYVRLLYWKQEGLMNVSGHGSEIRNYSTGQSLYKRKLTVRYLWSRCPVAKIRFNWNMSKFAMAWKILDDIIHDTLIDLQDTAHMQLWCSNFIEYNNPKIFHANNISCPEKYCNMSVALLRLPDSNRRHILANISFPFISQQTSPF